MNPGAVLIGIAILILSAAYVANPFLKSKHKSGKAALPKKENHSTNETVLVAIRDLDFDFQTGKVTKEDYEPLRLQLFSEAADYLQRKQERDQKIEDQIRSCQNEKQYYCSNCGKRVREKDLFCTGCGTLLTLQAALEEDARGNS